MRFDVITLFPELFAPFTQAGITRRAYDSGQMTLRLWNPREHAQGNYRRVDDRPFGGGPGMVMLAEPLACCLAAIQADRAAAQVADSANFDPAAPAAAGVGHSRSPLTAIDTAINTALDTVSDTTPNMHTLERGKTPPVSTQAGQRGQGTGPENRPFAPSGKPGDDQGEAQQGAQNGAQDPVPVILFSPIGLRLDHAAVTHWAGSAGAILICGRYEGIDQRFIDRHVTHQISLGDFVLSGGEIAALALLDAIARLQPGVLGDAGSHQADSFNPALDGLLDCPHYTRPEEWQGQRPPDLLLGGNHAHISRWRRQQSLLLTARLRPDLLAAARQAGRLSPADERWLTQATQATAG